MRQTTFVLLLMCGSFCLGWHFAPGPKPVEPMEPVEPWVLPCPSVTQRENTRPKPRPKPTDAQKVDLNQ